MGLPEQPPTEDQVILSDHPHWSTLLRTIVLLVVTAAVAGAAIVFMPASDLQGQIRLAVAVAAVLVALVVSVVPFLRWFATRYELSEQGLVIREGVLSRSVRTIPIGRVNDATHSQRLIERLLGKGTLTVESGGERGLVVLKNVPGVEQWHRQLYLLIDDMADGVRDGR
jgi:uncharacterized membrane protein YdbT with pleckstrin-like domain